MFLTFIPISTRQTIFGMPTTRPAIARSTA
jgi:hypothetical protein